MLDRVGSTCGSQLRRSTVSDASMLHGNTTGQYAILTVIPMGRFAAVTLSLAPSCGFVI